MITREEIILAYRLILGREPENNDVVENYLHTVHSLQELSEEFIKSPEFVAKISKSLDRKNFVRQRHPFDFPKIPVDTIVNEEALKKMFERISDAWEHMGFTEPYWSVLTQPQYKIKDFPKNKEQFYESSGPLFRNIIAALKRNGINFSEIETCLEVGCGTGRMTGYLADTFKNVIATDISSQHLVKAKNYFDSKNFKNINLIHWTSLSKLDDLSGIDLVISVITLQHNPPPIMLWILKKLLKALNPKGVAFIQIPTYRCGYMFDVSRYLNIKPENKIEMHFLPQAEIFKAIRDENCICLEIREDSMIGTEELMLSNSFLISKI